MCLSVCLFRSLVRACMHPKRQHNIFKSIGGLLPTCSIDDAYWDRNERLYFRVKRSKFNITVEKHHFEGRGIQYLTFHIDFRVYSFFFFLFCGYCTCMYILILLSSLCNTGVVCVRQQALDAAMKQFKLQAPHMACMFFSVDDDASKILCMSCVPEVCAVAVILCMCCVLFCQSSLQCIFAILMLLNQRWQALYCNKLCKSV